MDRAAIPSVDLLLRSVVPKYPHIARERLLSVAREVLQAVRELELPIEEIEPEIGRRVVRLSTPSLRRVINATGVVLHTNLGRAPLRAFEPVAGYSNLEYDLATSPNCSATASPRSSPRACTRSRRRCRSTCTSIRST